MPKKQFGDKVIGLKGNHENMAVEALKSKLTISGQSRNTSSGLEGYHFL